MNCQLVLSDYSVSENSTTGVDTLVHDIQKTDSEIVQKSRKAALSAGKQIVWTNTHQEKLDQKHNTKMISVLFCIMLGLRQVRKTRTNNTEEKILSSPSTTSQNKNASATKEYYKTTEHIHTTYDTII